MNIAAEYYLEYAKFGELPKGADYTRATLVESELQSANVGFITIGEHGKIKFI